ncbi:MAG: IclR family transcriptional regulator [Acidiphilium sp.]
MKNSDQMKPNVPLVRAVERAIRLLRAFSPAKPRLTLSELARLTDLDKGTTRRLLQTLTLNGLVEHDEETLRYALSAAVLELGAAVETGREFRNVAAPQLARVAMNTGCTTFLWVYREGMALCIERVRSGNFSIDVAWTNVGSRTTLNCGAGPRALLAFISPEERREALSGDLTKRTPLSQTDPEILTAESERVRGQGWELAIDDFVLGLAGLGVPVFDRDGRLLGTISITTLTPRLAGAEESRCLELLLTAAKEIGHAMR